MMGLAFVCGIGLILYIYVRGLIAEFSILQSLFTGCSVSFTASQKMRRTSRHHLISCCDFHVSVWPIASPVSSQY